MIAESLTIFLPAWNEEETIERAVASAFDAAARWPCTIARNACESAG